MFNTIQIQTYDYCNRSCSFCPNAKDVRKTNSKIVMGVFNRILDNLQSMRFRGRISPYMMNEPFLDERMFAICMIIRSKFPDNEIFLNTNGDWINDETIGELADSTINRIHINLYSDNNLVERRHTLLNLMAGYPSFNILSSSTQDSKECKLNVYIRTREELMSSFWNRGGNSSDVRHESIPGNICPLPSNQMYINYLGQAILCCSDWKFEVILGDITTSSIEDVWNSDEYQRIRSSLAKGIRSCTGLCSNCNY